MLPLLNNIILIQCNPAPDPPVSSVGKDQPQREEEVFYVIPNRKCGGERPFALTGLPGRIGARGK